MALAVAIGASTGGAVPAMAVESSPQSVTAATVKITGPIVAGEPVVVTSGPWPSGTTVDYEFWSGTQWLEAVQAGQSFSYPASAIGTQARVEAVGYDASQNVVGVVSSPSVTVQGCFADLPEVWISGDVLVGSSVSLAAGNAWPTGASAKIRWFADGDEVAVDTETYIPRAADLGRALTVSVEFTRASYITATVTSIASTVDVAEVLPGETPVITGTAEVGGSLAVEAGSLPPGTEITYAWKRGATVVSRAAHYVPVVADVGLSITVTVIGWTTDGSSPVGGTSSETLVRAGMLPQAPVLSFDSGRRVGGRTTVSGQVPQAGAAYAYEWIIDGITVARGASYTPPAQHVGKTLTVRATATVPGYRAHISSVSAGVIAVGTIAVTTPATVSGAGRVGAAFTVLGAWSPTPTLSYQWKVGGVVASTAKSFTPLPAHLGKPVTVTVTAAATGYASLSTTTAAVTVAAGAFVVAPTPVVTGKITVGGVLTASAGTWSPTATFSYQWKRNGVAISGATKKTYSLTSADWAKKVTVSVTAKRTGYQSTVRTSLPTAGVTKAFIKTVPPTIAGTTRVASTLTAKASGWSPNATFTFQWKRNGVSIAGATKSTYVLTAADRGKAVTVVATGHAVNIISQYRTSAATGKVL